MKFQNGNLNLQVSYNISVIVSIMVPTSTFSSRLQIAMLFFKTLLDFHKVKISNTLILTPGD